jgi:predicted DNA-binding antitoxin AbrB/MazE fold protein
MAGGTFIVYDETSTVEFIRMNTIRAVFENGVFRPTEPVDLPEHSVVEFDPRPVDENQHSAALDAVYEVLSRRYHSGQHDLAERHNEHQP